jgi:hypothetical protein
VTPRTTSDRSDDGQCWRLGHACGKGRAQQGDRTRLTGRDAPFAGAVAEDVLVTDGRLALVGKNINITYAELLARNGLATLAADADYDPIEEAKGQRPS